MRVGVGFHSCDGPWGEVSEVEDAPNPACRAECFPDQKCSQPKCPPAWLPPECPPEECPPPEWPPPPPCSASAGARRQITDSKIRRTRSDRTRKAVRVAMALPQCGSSLLLFGWSGVCDLKLRVCQLDETLGTGVDRIPNRQSLSLSSV
jgi:hypothetical protein